MARALMLQGTGSDVGKSVLVAGLCRAAANRGLKVLPFKPQNMSNNAAVAHGLSGRPGEIGRAQWLQALACRAQPSVDMNPVLIKPESETGAQIVVHGEVFGKASARSYQNLKADLMAAVMASWARLKSQADLIVVEGAGSPAEINLRDRDIANMGFAIEADVPVVLVGDIDRGGVIASIAGTHLILDARDRAMIAGFLINKFRGDLSLFDDGLSAITRFTGWRSFGVVPWLREAALLPSEDAVALDHTGEAGDAGPVIVVPMLPHISNFDDLDPLRAESGVSVRFLPPGRPWPARCDLIVLPGSKATMADLAVMRELGWDRRIARHAAGGGMVIGLCGGFQMLGRSIADPHGIEGDPGEAAGLGLLNVSTVLVEDKTVREASGHSVAFDAPVSGYEIHLGVTSGPDCTRPMLTIGGRPDGAISGDGQIMGSYLHGLFGSDEFRAKLLHRLGVQSHLADHGRSVDDALDAIASHLERHVDVDRLLAAAR
ncbi:MAG: cobyric acid synthase [Mesorhizobium sp.]